ncbi:hypothetical protein RB593_005830 [Gaeumannomyces tritici]
MPRLPPAEKLPLALRKNVRDDWENKKEGFEKELTELLGGVEWSLKEINPLAIWPYHNDGYAKESLGSCIAAYVAGAIYQLKYFIQQHGEEEAVKEINEIAYEHSMILDFDEEKKLGSYGGVEIADGRIRLGFAPQCLGTNVDYCIDGTKFAQALNDAAPAPGTSAPMSYLARNDIRMEYDAKIEETRKKLAEMLERPEIKLVPNFEEAFAKMTEAKAKDKKKVMRDDWQQNLGNFVRRYYEGLEYQAKYQKFGEVCSPLSLLGISIGVCARRPLTVVSAHLGRDAARGSQRGPGVGRVPLPDRGPAQVWLVRRGGGRGWRYLPPVQARYVWHERGLRR